MGKEAVTPGADETLRHYLDEVDRLQEENSAGDYGYAAMVELTEKQRNMLLDCVSRLGAESAARIQSKSFGKSLLHCFVMAADREGAEIVWDAMRTVCNSKGRTAEESFQVAWGQGASRDDRGRAFHEWLQAKRPTI